MSEMSPGRSPKPGGASSTVWRLAESATDYADRFWEGWAEEAVAALLAIEPAAQHPGDITLGTRSVSDVLQRTA